jgi:hypothetical protein
MSSHYLLLLILILLIAFAFAFQKKISFFELLAIVSSISIGISFSFYDAHKGIFKTGFGSVSRPSSTVLVSRLTGDNTGGQSRIFRIKLIRNLKSLGCFKEVTSHDNFFKSNFSKSDASHSFLETFRSSVKWSNESNSIDHTVYNLFNNNLNLNAIINGSDRWITINFRSRPDYSVKFSNSLKNINNLTIATQVPSTSLSYATSEETLRYLSLLLAVELSSECFKNNNFKDKVNFLRVASRMYGNWTSHVHKSFALWRVATSLIIQEISKSSNRTPNPSVLKCVKKLFLKALHLLGRNDQSALKIALLNNYYVSRFILFYTEAKKKQMLRTSKAYNGLLTSLTLDNNLKELGIEDNIFMKNSRIFKSVL